MLGLHVHGNSAGPAARSGEVRMQTKRLALLVMVIGVAAVALTVLLRGYPQRSLQATHASGAPFAAGPLHGLIHTYPETLTGTALLYEFRWDPGRGGAASWVVALDLGSRTARWAGEWNGPVCRVSPSGRFALGWEENPEAPGVWTLFCSDLDSSGSQHQWQTDALEPPDRHPACITENHVVGVGARGDVLVVFSHDGLSSRTVPIQASQGVPVPAPAALAADGNATDSVFLIADNDWTPRSTMLPDQLWHFDIQSGLLSRKLAMGLSMDSRGAAIRASNGSDWVDKRPVPIMTIRRNGLLGEVETRSERMAFMGLSSTGRWGVISADLPAGEQPHEEKAYQVLAFDTHTDSVYPVVTLADTIWPNVVLVDAPR